MKSLILETATRPYQPLAIFYSVYLLLGGHDEPGGGFVGGLVAASAFALEALAFGVPSARKSLRIHPHALASVGLAISFVTALVPLFAGRPILTALWGKLSFAKGELELGTPLLFDAGIYLLVCGATLTIIFELSEEMLP
jgi:multicomponent Na+:H+ antiporter subunit B